MREIRQTNKFRKSAKRVQKRGLEMRKLLAVVDLLANDQELPIRCRPHKLSGNYVDHWECHIAPDWLLIYQLDDDENTLILNDTGTHSDLFR